MRWSLKRTLDPTSEPVSLAEAKEHLRRDGSFTAEDPLITRLIKAAREHVEHYTGRQLIHATWRLWLDEFADAEVILLPKPPLASITAVAYYDTDGSPLTWDSANYSANWSAEPAELHRAYGVSWPSLRKRWDAFEVQYVAGYGAASSSVPEVFREGILQMLTFLYEHRGEMLPPGTMPKTVERLLYPKRCWFDAPWGCSSEVYSA